MPEMTSSKPYLLRALFEWITDNDHTPHVIVDAQQVEVNMPPQSVQDGRLVLNISPLATRNLSLDNEGVSFQARFSGVSQDIWLPMDAILAIYARENGQGMMFANPEDDSPGPSTEPPEDPPRPEGPKLRVIK